MRTVPLISALDLCKRLMDAKDTKTLKYILNTNEIIMKMAVKIITH